MRFKEFMKRSAALGLAAALVVSGSLLHVSAAPESGNGGGTVWEEAELFSAGEKQAAGGITPTAYEQAYRNDSKVKFRSRGTLPTTYDLRQCAGSTTVKDQAPWGSCWAFGSLSSLESSMLDKTGAGGTQEATAPDYSELQLAWFAYDTQNEESLTDSPAGAGQVGEGTSSASTGSERLNDGGNMPQAVALLSTWQGAANETDVPYVNQAGTIDASGDWTVDPSNRNNSAVHLQNADFLPTPVTASAYDGRYPSAGAAYTLDTNAVAAIKQAIMTNGAVAIAYYADQSMPEGSQDGTYFNYTNWCQYVDKYTVETVQNHSVSIVGWDDNFSKFNFNADKQPEGDGAWLVKNSWGSNVSWGIDGTGYFWLSYYDRTIDQVTSFQGSKTDNYDNNYQYDYLGLASDYSMNSQDAQVSVANVFTANGVNGIEELQAISAVTMAPNSAVKVEVYKIPEGGQGPVPAGTNPVAEQTFDLPYSGYHTLTLNKPVTLIKGEQFSIVETIQDSSSQCYVPMELASAEGHQSAVCNPGESYVIENDTVTDTSDMSDSNQDVGFGNVMIKAFTKNGEAEEAPAVSSLTYTAYDNNDTPIGDARKIDTDSRTSFVDQLPAGTSYVIIAADGVELTSGNKEQVEIKVNGSEYTPGDKIQKSDIAKGEDMSTLTVTTKSVPVGIDTKTYEFAFTSVALVLKADNDAVVVTDTNECLPAASAALTADKVTEGADYDGIRTALEPYGGADTFYVYNLTLNPALQEGQTVNLSIQPDSSYPAGEKTVLYQASGGGDGMSLTEVANNADGTLTADVSSMGYYVIAWVKDAPEVPQLGEITYSKNNKLENVVFPPTDGGSWSWDEPDTVPDVKTGAYAATFTPEEGSPYFTYKADVALKVNRAKPVIMNTQTGALTYGDTLSKVTPKAQAQEKGSSVSVEGTGSWKDGTICPQVSDSMNTRYVYTFEPTDSDNYESVENGAVVIVNPKSIEVTVKDAKKVYGDENPQFAIETPAGGVLAGTDTAEGLEMEFHCDADTATDVGDISITGTGKNKNYKVTAIPGILTITERPVDFQVKDAVIKYSGNLPESYDFEVSGLVNEATADSIGATVEIEPQDVPSGNPYGVYTLKIKSAELTDKNYKVGSFADGQLTIEPVKAGIVKNNSELPDSLTAHFTMTGNLTGDEVLHIDNVDDKAVLNAFKAMLKKGQKLLNVFDLRAKTAGGGKADITGALRLIIPVGDAYKDKQISVYHYVKKGDLNAAGEPVAQDTVDVYENLTVADGAVQITVYSLSPFATVGAEDMQEPVPGSPETKNPVVNSHAVNGAQTGDTSPVMLLMIVMAAAVVVIVSFTVARLKRRKK